MSLHGGVIIVRCLSSYTIVDKACSTPDLVLVAVVTRDLITALGSNHYLVLKIGHLALVHVRAEPL